ncbi:acylneuraminate cytidylyltransferase family protein [Rhodobacterales bacterium HKCCA1058]|nr:acylneuraminate cytidylyltransferase family protein [Rhodobacterales bacterium HKCCA1058]
MSFYLKSLAVIIARGGSKGIPRKNLSDIGGKPLVAHIINTALKAAASENFDVIFSTDSEEIRRVAVGAGAWAPFLRPSELAADDVPSWPVVQHAVREAESIKQTHYDLIVYLQPTAPLCRAEDILRCMHILQTSPEAESAVAVTEVGTHPFRMKRMLSDGRLINYIDQGFEDMRPRQQLPKVYRRAGSIYVSRRKVVMEHNTLVGDPCIGVLVPPGTAVDIDTEIDLEMVRLLYAQNKSALGD